MAIKSEMTKRITSVFILQFNESPRHVIKMRDVQHTVKLSSF
jgi:hypothetical protein